MPEGPSIVIAKEQMSEFIGHKVIAASGNAKIDIARIEDKKLLDIRTWGKHLLLCFDEFTVRIHFLLFGTYRVNETKEAKLRLGLVFNNGQINFYTAAVKVLEGDINSYYDWTADVMQDVWGEKSALEKLADKPKLLICDALLEQDIFSGVGNIIKNEVLYRVRVHPESVTGKITKTKLKEIADQARIYSFDFLKWKKEGTLKKNWLAHTKKVCKRCDLPMHKKYTGTKKTTQLFLHELPGTLLMKHTVIHIGCSSYATPSWQPLFFPEGLPKKQWFEYYCKYFNTYELNSTFYRFPTLKSLESWYEKAPEGFKFSIKAPKTITHIKKFTDCKEEIEKFYSISRKGLKDKLACVLFQFPPSFSYSSERLETVVSSLDNGFDNVIEFRNESWWRQDVIESLADHNITFCSVNYPKLPTSIVKTSPIGYVRMHGNPKLFYSEYTRQQIEDLYRDLINKGFKDVFLYFNNTASTAGIINALEAKRIIRKCYE